ncbi:DUF3224 domain-containing protein [Catellatospora coxensis]|uniref:DUF3224 domain-containing protein n=1 Tax=Catellatospora coxensis TaxID=310354 RepID=A0A8J3P4U5_9ACTN|nr:DUF3224 domain-containing protein [Catellatospora coxensis]GIG03709.1 hypothetical protein Cco03nite_04090 [Catellatospora coxensis]
MTKPTSTTADTRTLTTEFEVTGWEPTVYDEPGEGPALARVVVRKTFRGVVDGTSVAEVLTAAGPDGRGYVASERFVGAIEGRTGTLVFQHCGLDDNDIPHAFGHIVPGSGTGQLAGLTGQITFVHDDSGAHVTLVLRRTGQP